MTATMRPLSLVLALALVAAGAPAYAQAADKDEKLPAQLPSVTIQGQDQSGTGLDGQTKLAPTAGIGGQRVRLPEPPQRRATSEGNRALMVNVTPSTLETPAPLPGPQMPYTSLMGGYFPLNQYQVGLYDGRLWGPVLGTTELWGRAGWGWTELKGKEWLDWAGVGRLSLRGDTFGWSVPRPGAAALAGTQSYFQGAVETGESENLIAGAGLASGMLDNGTLSATTAGAMVQYRPGPWGDHQLTTRTRAQYRSWGRLSGPEALLELEDFWSLDDTVQLEAGLGGGYWGFEPILNPTIGFHFRPQPATHLYARLRTASELPDYEKLYLRRPAVEANTALQAERVEGWAELGASHRFSDEWSGQLGLDLKRSYRLIYWADLDGDGRWMPTNASSEQFAPGATARLTRQWTPGVTSTLVAKGRTIMPLGLSEWRAGLSLDGAFLEDKLGVGAGLEGRGATLSTQQVARAASATGVFGRAQLSYALTRDWTLSLTAEDVPLALMQASAPNYFAPVPLLTANVQYQF